MSKIEAGLHAHYASMAAQPQSRTTSSSSEAVSTNNGTAADIIETPFAKVNTVVPGSPAELAGLKAGDGIRRFGSVNWINHERLSKVAEVATRNEGVSNVIWSSSLEAVLTNTEICTGKGSTKAYKCSRH
jgi:26S proteasome non-ATPase regulatory subunit 9